MHRNFLSTLAVLSALSTGACRVLVELVIEEEGASAADSGPVSSDGSDGLADANVDPDADNAACLIWGFSPIEIDPCLVPDPGDPLVLTAGRWLYNTDSGALRDPSANETFPPSSLNLFGGGDEIRVISVGAFTVEAGASLRAEGVRPLAIVSWSNAAIDGDIDLSSTATQTGAGSNPNACLAALPGENTSDGGGGGGGGGLASQGGNGGSGRFGQGSGGTAGQVVSPITLRGGCSGAGGGNTTGGSGGAGGGGIAIVALERISVSGRILAGGAGGTGADEGQGGGGGGGSGGVIQLEAPAIVLTDSAVLAANGGGGGGGCDNNTAGPGQDGQPSASAANGGTKEGKGADGGDGSDEFGSVGEDGRNAEKGGGGGGGGAGDIALRSLTPETAQSAVISPPF